MSVVYVDSNVVISLIEGGVGWRAAIVSRLAGTGYVASALVVSDLVRLECRVKPLATGSDLLLEAYDSFFASPGVHTAKLTTEVCDRATRIRALYRFDTSDALHLAAAIESGCDVFVTADRQLAAFGDLAVLLVSPQ